MKLPAWWPWVSRRRYDDLFQHQARLVRERDAACAALARVGDTLRGDDDVEWTDEEAPRWARFCIDDGRTALRHVQDERDAARAEVERLRKIIRETWRRFDSANDAITDQLIWLHAEMQGWANES